MDVVILAAGYGTRLNTNNNFPKGFIKIGDISIVEKNIINIYNVSEINKIIVVTNKIFKNAYNSFLKKLEIKHIIIINEYVERGNGYSLFLAEKVKIVDLQTVGQNNNHLKVLVHHETNKVRKTIGFCFGHWCDKLKIDVNSH